MSSINRLDTLSSIATRKQIGWAVKENFEKRNFELLNPDTPSTIENTLLSLTQTAV